MKNKKYIFLVGIILLINLITIFDALAHPGRTDSNGGHWDRENGTYHFHTGEYAGKSSSGNSPSSEYVPFTPPYEPPKENPYRIQKKFSAFELVLWIIGFGGCLLFAIPVLIYIIAFIIYMINIIRLEIIKMYKKSLKRLNK